MAAKPMSTDQIKGKLLQGAFTSSAPMVGRLSDPIVDTPMVLTLDQLKPYDHNPRLNRNPRYDDLRASIQSRGLDAPPPVTRRVGDEHFIIRNGGNTRLAILNELWRETGDERFFRIHCLFRPWPSRGEIVALTGHLAESDLHGELTFIERALGVERAREFYQLEVDTPISQRELAKLLKQDGYPISQPHISKMQDAVRYLLPAIPNALYGGLGKPQIEKLTSLRRASEKAWLKHAGATPQEIEHEHLFQEVLSLFDQGEYSYERFQDELVHKMGQLLGQDYNSLKLDVLEPDRSYPIERPEPAVSGRDLSTPIHAVAIPTQRPQLVPGSIGLGQNAPDGLAQPDEPVFLLHEDEQQARIESNTLSAIAGVTTRTQVIKHQLAQATGEAIPRFEDSCLQSIPIQAGGLHPVADLWYIERAVDSPDSLRQAIFGLVQDIATEVSLPHEYFTQSDWGIGFLCARPADWGNDLFSEAPMTLSPEAYTVLNLLDGLSGRFAPALHLLREDAVHPAMPEMNSYRLLAELGQLLLGGSPLKDQPASLAGRLSDVALVKLFRVIRLGRRLIELESKQSFCDVIQ
ncbi:ParB family protein [Pseudomonas fluorescens BBc6R8]|uniref:ParB family protein n=1 Tax=Pseudomonas fluorescens TaxID=294 RepID=UPI000281CB53|nr:ParB family protein [Pseudomonas fluorescens]QQD55324.1 ParB family protein [Pseudomonas fluorescens BBc6R8]